MNYCITIFPFFNQKTPMQFFARFPNLVSESKSDIDSPNHSENPNSCALEIQLYVGTGILTCPHEG